MEFTYKAKTNKGELIKGEIEAKDQDSACTLLREKSLYIIDIKTKKGGIDLKNLFNKKVGIKEKIIFTKQLGVMIKAGLSIIEALEALSDETENKNFSKLIDQMISDIKGGIPLSAALRKHPKVFSEIYINMVKSGEESGKLELVLSRLTKQLEKDYDLNRKVKGALAYPTFVMFALIAVMVLIMTLIIPNLKTIFDDAGVELPLLTRIIMGMSFFLKNNIIMILIAVFVLMFLLFWYTKTKTGKRNKDFLVVRIPVIGALLKKTYYARFTRTFASLTASGLPLVDVFNVASNTVGNVYYKEEIARMAEKIKTGREISTTLKDSKLMPKMVGQLATVGEKSGNLDEVFDTLADFYDRDVETATATLSTMLEPILMVVMGVGIGLVIVSVLQPIYGLVNAI